MQTLPLYFNQNYELTRGSLACHLELLNSFGFKSGDMPSDDAITTTALIKLALDSLYCYVESPEIQAIKIL